MSYKHPYILIFIGLAFFCAVAFSLQLFTNIHSPEYIAKDSYSYMEAGKLLYNEGKPHPTRPYLSGAVLGLPYLVNSKAFVHTVANFNLVLNLALWFCTIILIYRTVLLFESKRLAFLSAMTYVFCVGTIGFIGLILTETLSAFMLAWAVYLAFRYQKYARVSDITKALVIMLLLVLVKPGMIYWSLLLLLIVVIMAFRSGELSIRRIFPIALSLGLILLQAWQIHSHYGKFSVSLIDKITWYNYLGAETEAISTNRALSEVKAERMKIWDESSWLEISEIGSADMKRQIKLHPSLILKEFVLNIAENAVGKSAGLAAAKDFNGSSVFKPIQSSLLTLSILQNLFMVVTAILIGFYILLKKRMLNVATFLAMGTIAYIIFTSGISFKAGDRFNVVFYPIVLMVVPYLMAKSGLDKKLKLN